MPPWDLERAIELAAVLKLQWERTKALESEMGKIIPYVFHRNGEPISTFRRSWITACKLAGVPNRIPHDFRRTAARNLIALEYLSAWP